MKSCIVKVCPLCAQGDTVDVERMALVFNGTAGDLTTRTAFLANSLMRYVCKCAKCNTDTHIVIELSTFMGLMGNVNDHQLVQELILFLAAWPAGDDGAVANTIEMLRQMRSAAQLMHIIGIRDTSHIHKAAMDIWMSLIDMHVQVRNKYAETFNQGPRQRPDTGGMH